MSTTENPLVATITIHEESGSLPGALERPLLLVLQEWWMMILLENQTIGGVGSHRYDQTTEVTSPPMNMTSTNEFRPGGIDQEGAPSRESRGELLLVYWTNEEIVDRTTMTRVGTKK
jgi:hypothetical protein